MNHLILEHSPLSSNCLIFFRLISDGPKISRKISVFEPAQLWDEFLRKESVFFYTFRTLLWSWWITIRKLNPCFITFIITHVSGKWTPKSWVIWSWVRLSQLIGSWLLACMKSWRWNRAATERFFLDSVASSSTACWKNYGWSLLISWLINEGSVIPVTQFTQETSS